MVFMVLTNREAAGLWRCHAPRLTLPAMLYSRPSDGCLMTRSGALTDPERSIHLLEKPAELRGQECAFALKIWVKLNRVADKERKISLIQACMYSQSKCEQRYLPFRMHSAFSYSVLLHPRSCAHEGASLIWRRQRHSAMPSLIPVK